MNGGELNYADFDSNMSINSSKEIADIKTSILLP